MAETALAVLPTTADKSAWSTDQQALMKSLGLQGVRNRKGPDGAWRQESFEAPPDIVQAFLYQVKRTGLDPVARQIYCIERGGKWGIQASIDGFRVIAERKGSYAGQTPAQWTGDGRDWVDVWVPREPPVAARIGIYRTGFVEPIWAVATYEGYCPRNRDGVLAPTGQWLVNAPNQLAKCAEMLGLRKAFPQDLSGIYGTEEMEQAQPVEAPAQARRPAAPPAPERKATKDWARAARACKSDEALRRVYQEAEEAGELGLSVHPEDVGAPTVAQLIATLHAQFVAQEPVTESGDAAGPEPGEPVADWPAREPGSGVTPTEPSQQDEAF